MGISPEYPGITLQESLRLVARLSKAGVDFIHLSCWDCFKRSRDNPLDPRTLTEWFTSFIPGLPPVMSAGEIWTPDDAQRVMHMGADFVAVARSAIGKPDWESCLSAYPPTVYGGAPGKVWIESNVCALYAQLEGLCCPLADVLTRG